MSLMVGCRRERGGREERGKETKKREEGERTREERGGEREVSDIKVLTKKIEGGREGNRERVKHKYKVYGCIACCIIIIIIILVVYFKAIVPGA